MTIIADVVWGILLVVLAGGVTAFFWVMWQLLFGSHR
jgi:hypothetical protein